MAASTYQSACTAMLKRQEDGEIRPLMSGIHGIHVGAQKSHAKDVCGCFAGRSVQVKRVCGVASPASVPSDCRSLRKHAVLTHVYTDICTCIYLHNTRRGMCIHVYMYIHIYIHIHVYVFAYTHIYCILCIHIHIHTYTFMCMHSHTFTTVCRRAPTFCQQERRAGRVLLPSALLL